MKEKEGEGSASDLPMSPGKTSRERRQDLKVAVVIWLGYFVFALFWQIQSGAWSSDFGGHADEAAHVVTGLMVRDYIAGGFLEQWHPMRYAEDYYERFPKVAIGHYPPGFYVVEALFLLPYRQPGAVLVMMVCLAATVGWQTWRIARDLGLESWVGVLLGALVIWLPLVRTYTAIVMSDLLLVILILEATRAFGRFLEKQRWRDSWAFGIFAALAILTKGSGLLLALVPPLAIALTGRWKLIKSPRLWVAPIPVVVLALPWMLATRHITEEGMSHLSLLSYIPSAVVFYLLALGRELGWLWLTILVLAGAACAFRRFSRRKASTQTRETTLWSLLIAIVVFYVAIPSGLDARYLLPTLPVGAVLVATSGLRTKVERHPESYLRWVLAMFVFLVIFETFRPVEKRFTGASELIAGLKGLELLDNRQRTTLLVISDAAGEGAIISAAAFQAKDQISVRRGTKVLWESDWLGRGYRGRFGSLTELRSILQEETIDYIALESLSGEDRLVASHWRLAFDLLDQSEPSEKLAEKVDSFRSQRKLGRESEILLYRFEKSGLPMENATSIEIGQPPLGAGMVGRLQ